MFMDFIISVWSSMVSHTEPTHREPAQWGGEGGGYTDWTLVKFILM